jgi:enoyl-CoA hydratase/carnithine racemase
MFSRVTSRYIVRNITATTGGSGGRTFRYLSSSSLKDSYDNILVDITETGEKKNVALITLNRPKALNALNDALFEDLLHATKVLDDDTSIRCMVLTGSKKAFAAGADISEMKDKMYEDCYATDMFSEWQRISKLRTPIIAAVSGFCLGGGCELAMMTDMSELEKRYDINDG